LTPTVVECLPVEVRRGRRDHWFGDRAVRHNALDRKGDGAPLQRENVMNWLYVIAGLIAVGLVIYLLVALLKPEELG